MQTNGKVANFSLVEHIQVSTYDMNFSRQPLNAVNGRNGTKESNDDAAAQTIRPTRCHTQHRPYQSRSC